MHECRGNAAVALEHAVPEVPLERSAGIVGLETVHHVVAAGEDQLRLVGELLDVMQAGGQAFTGAQLRLDVNVGEMRDSQRTPGRGLDHVGERRPWTGAPSKHAGRRGTQRDHRFTPRDVGFVHRLLPSRVASDNGQLPIVPHVFSDRAIDGSSSRLQTSLDGQC